MDRNEYPEMGNHSCFPAGATAGEMIYPKLYYKIHPFVMEACDEMDMHGVMMPTRHMMRCMCGRMCERIFSIHPEMAKYDVEYEAMADDDPPPTPGMGGLAEEFSRMFPGEAMSSDLEDLRRRHPMEFEDFRRRHPESFRRGSVFRDFLEFLLLLEFLRRRRR